jgi:hypothetical protein
VKAFVTPLAVFAIFISLMGSGCSVARPLHRSEAKIRDSILKRTPLGTTKKEVEAFIGKEGWQVMPDSRAVKQNDIEVLFGGYAIFFGTCNVYGVWKFDDSDLLIEMSVSKSHDVL